VEVRDAADHGRAGHDVVALGGQLDHQLGILRVALDQPVARMRVVAAPHGPVFAEVVQADDLVPGLEQVGDEVAADEPAGAGDQELQSLMGPVIPQMSTTSRLSSSRRR
jgi:hypothetical protein